MKNERNEKITPHGLINIELSDHQMIFCTKKIKKIMHMWRRWGTTQNFCLAFTDELEKQHLL